MDEASKVGGLADPKLLETIDKLFEYNIGKYVDLPQVRSSSMSQERTETNTSTSSSS